MQDVKHLPSYAVKKDRGNLLPLIVALCMLFNGCREEPSVQKPKATETLPAIEVRQTTSPAEASVTSPASASVVPSAATQPTTISPAVEGVPAFQPLSDAQVGEWASYRALDSRGLRYDIIEAAGPTVRTSVRAYAEGKPLGQPAAREDARDADLLARQAALHNASRQAKRVQVQINGRTWNAMLYEARWIDEEIHYVRRTWVSADAPVFGLLRMEMYGDDALEASMELTDFGQSTDQR